MDNDQTFLYEHRALTHTLQPPAQEISPFSTVISPGSQLLSTVVFRGQTSVSSHQLRNLSQSGSPRARIRSLPSIFPKFCPYF